MLTQKDVWTALVAGETICVRGVLYKFQNGALIESSQPGSKWFPSTHHFKYSHNCEIYVKPEWYDNMAHPVLCWVRDFGLDSHTIRLITHVQPGIIGFNGNVFIDSCHVSWKYATPLTDEEWEKYKLM